MLSASTSQALEALLHHPSTCLPHTDLKHQAFGFAPVIDPEGTPLYLPDDRVAFVRTIVNGGSGATPKPAPEDIARVDGGDIDFEAMLLLGAGFGEGQRFQEMDVMEQFVAGGQEGASEENWTGL